MTTRYTWLAAVVEISATNGDIKYTSSTGDVVATIPPGEYALIGDGSAGDLLHAITAAMTAASPDTISSTLEVALDIDAFALTDKRTARIKVSSSSSTFAILFADAATTFPAAAIGFAPADTTAATTQENTLPPTLLWVPDETPHIDHDGHTIVGALLETVSGHQVGYWRGGPHDTRTLRFVDVHGSRVVKRHSHLGGTMEHFRGVVGVGGRLHVVRGLLAPGTEISKTGDTSSALEIIGPYVFDEGSIVGAWEPQETVDGMHRFAIPDIHLRAAEGTVTSSYHAVDENPPPAFGAPGYPPVPIVSLRARDAGTVAEGSLGLPYDRGTQGAGALPAIGAPSHSPTAGPDGTAAWEITAASSSRYGSNGYGVKVATDYTVCCIYRPTTTITHWAYKTGGYNGVRVDNVGGLLNARFRGYQPGEAATGVAKDKWIAIIAHYGKEGIIDDYMQVLVEGGNAFSAEVKGDWVASDFFRSCLGAPLGLHLGAAENGTNHMTGQFAEWHIWPTHSHDATIRKYIVDTWPTTWPGG